MTTQRTPITSLPYPDLNSAPNVPGDMQALATALDTITVPRFANVAARNAITPVTGMFCVTTDTGYAWQYNGTKWLRRSASIDCVADSSWTSNTSLAAIPSANTLPAGGLSFPADINSRYDWELEALIIGQTNVGLSVAVNQPATGARTDWGGFGLNSTAGAFNGRAQNLTTASNVIGTFTSAYFRIIGTTLIGATAGTVSFTFAQGVANAATSWLLIGSRLCHRQIS